MKLNSRNSARTSIVIAATLLSGSMIGISSSQAVTSTPAKHFASATTQETYKADYAAWLVSVHAWNMARVQQIAAHLDARNAYAALMISNRGARLAIDSARVSAVTLANNIYASAILKAPTNAVKASLLKVRTASIAAAVATSTAALAALPPLGTKPVWPVASPRPVKPAKPEAVAKA